MQGRLKRILNTWTICNLPAFSAFPKGLSAREAVAFIHDAGYDGLQMEVDDPLINAGLEAGLHMSATGRVIYVAAADALCVAHKARGFKLTTLHVGTGFETQDEGRKLMAAVLEASARHAYPLYVETHRATLTQDPRRTLDFLTEFPDLYLNADISHWYAGCEMPYGDFEAKLSALQPVFDRTRYIHGRMADSSCMQVPVAKADASNTRHFVDIWKRCFSGFLAHAPAGLDIWFAPELLPNWASLGGKHVEINYARLTRGPGGTAVEETDRWLEGLKLCDLADQAFKSAVVETAKFEET